MTTHKSSCVTVEIPTLAEKLLWTSCVSSLECIFFDLRTFHDLNRACCNTCRSVRTVPVSFRLSISTEMCRQTDLHSI